MNFAVIGGDERMVHLARLLRRDGHTVRCFALEKAAACEESPAAAVTEAQAVILPVPCCRGDALNAPLSAGTYDMKTILGAIPSGTVVLAGMTAPIERRCAVLGLSVYDYFAREELAVRNAALTAEGAVELLLKERQRSLSGAKVLISGFGRIGRLLSPRLAAMGASVTVLARSSADLAWARCMGFTPLDMKKEWSAAGFDIIVNTVPATVFTAARLAETGDAMLLELASAPYGFDMTAAKSLGKAVLAASGLPGKCAAVSAAEAIKDSVYQLLEEL